MGPLLRVATVNLLVDRSRWAERRPLLVAGLRAQDADLIALQEVRDPLGESTAHEVARDLGGYSVHVAPKAGRAGRREGIAVLSRLPVGGHEVLDLGGQRRVAQFVRVAAGGRAVALANAHYFFPVGAHAAQARQVGRVLDRFRALAPGTLGIACGDFNARPESRAVGLMNGSFISAHRARHGREPDHTCPSGLIGGGRWRRAATRRLLGLCGVGPRDVWRATLDYLFVDPAFRVVEAGVFLDRPDHRDPTLYASDHLGVAATLEVPPP